MGLPLPDNVNDGNGLSREPLRVAGCGAVIPARGPVARFRMCQHPLGEQERRSRLAGCRLCRIRKLPCGALTVGRGGSWGCRSEQNHDLTMLYDYRLGSGVISRETIPCTDRHGGHDVARGWWGCHSRCTTLPQVAARGAAGPSRFASGAAGSLPSPPAMIVRLPLPRATSIINDLRRHREIG